MGFGLRWCNQVLVPPRDFPGAKGKMTVHCHRCGTTNLRPAHFRWGDLAYLLTLRSPVRCRYCRLRFYASVSNVRKIRRQAEERHARGEDDVDVEQAGSFER